MAVFYGAVGYIDAIETNPDVFEEKPVERMYKGRLTKNTRRLENGIGLNDNVTISNTISIIADPYAINHMHTIRYVKWRGVAWKVTNVEAKPPRLNLTLGGVYNGSIKEDGSE